MSNTICVKANYTNQKALEKVAELQGHKLLGKGTHKLYGSRENGLGMQLKGWKFPVVFKDDGSVAFDDYHGHWGNPADLTQIKTGYTLEAAKLQADFLGWYHEQQGDKVLVHHPTGGVLTVEGSSGSIDANGFLGGVCAEATRALMAGIGVEESQTLKPEFNHTQAQIQTIDQS